MLIVNVKLKLIQIMKLMTTVLILKKIIQNLKQTNYPTSKMILILDLKFNVIINLIYLFYYFCRKLTNYLSWDDFFMATAFLVAKRSKDPVTQVGACIVNPDKKIVGTGYNGMPIGCSDDDFPWGKQNPSKLDNKYFYGNEVKLFIIYINNKIIYLIVVK